MKTAEERASWLAERMGFVTASDVAPVMGLSPHKTRTNVFNEKVGTKAMSDIDGLPQVMAGKFLESGILAWHLAHRSFDGVGWDQFVESDVPTQQLADLREELADRITPTGLVRHPHSRILAATPDAIVIPPASGKVWATEIKNVDKEKPFSDWAKTWVSGDSTTVPDACIVHATKWQKIDARELRAPVYYWAQLQAQLSCLGLTQGRIVVCFGGNARADLDYRLDNDFERRMLTTLDKFWADVSATKELLG